jgi:hypothetical protein
LFLFSLGDVGLRRKLEFIAELESLVGIFSFPSTSRFFGFVVIDCIRMVELLQKELVGEID